MPMERRKFLIGTGALAAGGAAALGSGAFSSQCACSDQEFASFHWHGCSLRWARPPSPLTRRVGGRAHLIPLFPTPIVSIRLNEPGLMDQRS